MPAKIRVPLVAWIEIDLTSTPTEAGIDLTSGARRVVFGTDVDHPLMSMAIPPNWGDDDQI